MIQDFADRWTHVYVLVDELCHVVAAPSGRRPGPRSAFSDSEVLALSAAAALLGLDEESAFLRHLARKHQALFPQLPRRSRYYRWRQLIEATNRIRGGLLQLALGRLAPVVRGCVPWTACQAHSLASTARGDHRFALASANHNDLALVEQLLMDKSGFTTLGDMRYINAALHCPLAWHNDFTSLTPKRAIQGVQLPAALTAAVVHLRQIIEMVRCQLTGQSHLQHNHARCAAGFCALVQAKLTAHATRLYLNCLLGKPLLALIPLAMIEHNG